VSSADSTSQWCFKFRTVKWCADYGTALVRLRAWPLRPTALGIGAWSYGTALVRLRAWCLRRTEPDSGACSYGTESARLRAYLVPVSGAWALHIYNVLLRLVLSAYSTSQWCFKFRTVKWCADYGTALVRLRAWPLRPTALGIGAWSYETATARLRAWCLRPTEPDSVAGLRHSIGAPSRLVSTTYRT